MRTAVRIIFIVLFIVGIDACKTQEPVAVANYYKPVFDQTKKVYARTPSISNELDTTVLIRSNLRDTIAFYWDTITLNEQFIITAGELAVPVELINEKPPTYDTFLVAKEYFYKADYVNMLFPVLPDSILNKLSIMSDTLLADSDVFFNDSLALINDTLNINVDSTNFAELVSEEVTEVADKESRATKKERGFSIFLTSIFKSKEQIQADKSRKIIDRNIQLSQERKEVIDSIDVSSELENNVVNSTSLSINDLLTTEEIDSSLFVEEPVEIKLFYTKEEILADSTRDLFDADNLLASLLNEAPWKVSDSIPFLSDFPTYYLDSVLILNFDTVYVEVYDPEKVIPQLPIDELSHEIIDTIYEDFTIHTKDQVTFRIYHPEEDDVYIEMVRIVGGNFKIGNNEFDEDERPAYNIKVSNYLLSKYEVTNKLFCYFLNDLNCDSLGLVNGLKVIDLFHRETKIKQNVFTKKFAPIDGFDDYPVVNVTWVGSQLFCKTAGGRLPSEAEWEYAAKGGVYARRKYNDSDQTDYEYVNRFAGGNFLHDYAWFVDNSRGQVWVGGRKLPNELGLYDMCGNVWEWCYDKYNKEFYKRNSKSRDPMCLEGPNVRVNRGGSWSSDAMYCRITNRNFLNQYEQNQYLGFRYMRQW